MLKVIPADRVTVICSLCSVIGLGGARFGDNVGSFADLTTPPICSEPKAKLLTNADPQFTKLQNRFLKPVIVLNKLISYLDISL